MKRFASWFLVMALLIPVVAMAEPLSFDFSGKSFEELVEMRTAFNAEYARALAALPTNPGERIDEATRRIPAVVGQHIKAVTKVDNYAAEIDLVVDEMFRGEEFNKLIKGGYIADLNDPGTQEFIAVKVTVTFVKVLDTLAKGDDPQFPVDNIFNFMSYDSTGSEYDNVHYGLSGKPEVKSIYEGASTTGYMYFAINKDDPAPYLVFKPQMFDDSRYWISLR